MLKPIPFQPDNDPVVSANVVKTLRDYADYLEADGSAVALAMFVLGDDGISQTWIRAEEAHKTILAEHLQNAGDDLADGSYGTLLLADRQEH